MFFRAPNDNYVHSVLKNIVLQKIHFLNGYFFKSTFQLTIQILS